MYLFRNTFSRAEANDFVDVCNSIGVFDDAYEGARVYSYDRVTRDGVPYTKVTAYCNKWQFDILASRFETRGKAVK